MKNMKHIIQTLHALILLGLLVLAFVALGLAVKNLRAVSAYPAERVERMTIRWDDEAVFSHDGVVSNAYITYCPNGVVIRGYGTTLHCDTPRCSPWELENGTLAPCLTPDGELGSSEKLATRICCDWHVAYPNERCL